MPKSPFIIEEASASEWRLYWDDSEGEPGFCVGDSFYKVRKEPDPEKERGNWEVFIVEREMKKAGFDHDKTGYSWESHSGANEGKKVALQALRAGAPMPDWAVKATQAGWRPPKGWKP